MPDLKEVVVCPTRLSPGKWSHKFNKQVGEGDVSASYSADCIGLGKSIRRPFNHAGSLWVSVGVGSYGCGIVKISAYRLVVPAAFPDPPTTYRTKIDIDGGESARGDPKGFYHGMKITHGKQPYVMCGPPTLFVPGKVR